jgi:hypothetical protein
MSPTSKLRLAVRDTVTEPSLVESLKELSDKKGMTSSEAARKVLADLGAIE